MPSAALEFHIATGDSLLNNVFRYGTEAWCELIREARELYERGEFTELYDDDLETLEGDIAKTAVHDEDGEVLLEVPLYDWNREIWVTYVRDQVRNRIVKVTLPRYTFEVYGRAGL
jgi:hypothetical protein